MAFKIAILACAGLDNAGGTTIIQEMEDAFKLRDDIEFKVYCNKRCTFSAFPEGEKEEDHRKNKTFILFDSFKKVYKELKDGEFDILLISSSPTTPADSLGFKLLLEKLDVPKVIIATDRTKSALKCIWYQNGYIENITAVFTLMGTENRIIQKLASYSEALPIESFHTVDINFFEWNRKAYKKLMVPFKDKDDRMSFIGRFVSVKGWQHYLGAFGSKLFPKNYAYTCEGGWFKYKEETKEVGTTIGILAVICESLKPKVIRKYLQLHSNYKGYENLKADGKVHLYPPYDRKEMLKRAATAKYIISPYCYKKPSEGAFETSLEYAGLECIAVGTPLILTNNFANEFKINGRTLLSYGEEETGLIFIDSFNQIEKKVKAYEKNYDKNVAKMQKFFESNYNNELRTKLFVKKLKKVVALYNAR